MVAFNINIHFFIRIPIKIKIERQDINIMTDNTESKRVVEKVAPIIYSPAGALIDNFPEFKNLDVYGTVEVSILSFPSMNSR